MNKEAVVGIYTMEYYLAVKKEWNLAICDALEGPRGHYAKWNKSVKNKYLMISLMCGIFKKKNKTKFVDTENRLVIARVKRWRVGKMGERSQKVQTHVIK